jgi:hypothetical protein
VSSKFVRDELLNFITTQCSTEKVVDLTSEVEDLQQLLTYHEIPLGGDWTGVHFIGSSEIPIALNANNTQGTYKEIGVVYIHVVALASLGGHNAILSRAEAIRSLLRGSNINSILIESVTPPNFGSGVSINFAGGYTSASFMVHYMRNLSP